MRHLLEINKLAGFLAEFGDLSGYEHGQQLIRLAGLNLKENSSGKKKASPALRNVDAHA